MPTLELTDGEYSQLMTVLREVAQGAWRFEGGYRQCSLCEITLDVGGDDAHNDNCAVTISKQLLEKLEGK